MIAKPFAPEMGVKPFMITEHVTGVTGEIATGHREVRLALGHVSHGVTNPKCAPELRQPAGILRAR
jgi:hypothetical protein